MNPPTPRTATVDDVMPNQEERHELGSPPPPLPPPPNRSTTFLSIIRNNKCMTAVLLVSTVGVCLCVVVTAVVFTVLDKKRNPVNVQELGVSDHVYVTGEGSKSYSNAESGCEAISPGRHILATAKTQGETDALTQFLNARVPDDFVWIGLKKSGGQFKWSDGTAFVKLFFKKDPEQRAMESCVYVLKSSNQWQWGSIDCTIGTNRYVCQQVREDGAWGSWTEWSSCSKTCGPGDKHRSRKCDSPPPSMGGARCAGDEEVHEDCNSGECPVSTTTTANDGDGEDDSDTVIIAVLGISALAVVCFLVYWFVIRKKKTKLNRRATTDRSTSLQIGTSGVKMGTRSTGMTMGTRSSGSTMGTRSTGSTMGTRSSGSTMGTRSTGFSMGTQSSGSTMGTRSTGFTMGTQSSGSTMGTRSTGFTMGTQSSGSTMGTRSTGFTTGTQSSSLTMGTRSSGVTMGRPSSRVDMRARTSGVNMKRKHSNAKRSGLRIKESGGELPFTT